MKEGCQAQRFAVQLQTNYQLSELLRSITILGIMVSAQWALGELCVDGTWQRVGMDITHFHGRHYLSLIDCGPSRFAAWRHLRRQDSSSVMQQLESVFLERGAPFELLMDNDTAFRSVVFKRFLDRWAVRAHFRCAYVAFGSGIVERCHRSVTRIAARKQCSIAEAVY